MLRNIWRTAPLRSGYRGHPRGANVPMFGYVGYKFTPEDRIAFGLDPSPFDLTLYFGTRFPETLGFAMGPEEVCNLGGKLSHVEPEFNCQVGFYPGSNPNAFGLSLDSARDSTGIVRSDSYVPFGTGNAEPNMVAGRVESFVVTNDLAARAAFVSGEATDEVAGPIGPFTVVPFAGDSAFYKDKANVRDNGRFTLGGTWTFTPDPGLIVHIEAAIGRSDPDVGAGQFAIGGENRWKTRFIRNIGYCIQRVGERGGFQLGARNRERPKAL